MSLAVLANDMASRGRGEDSMLVHMTPHEVAGLQALAMKHGGSLTINPDTGLPEAGFLKSLLPMLAGIALGPAGFGLMSAGMAGLTVGGLTTLATGSLSRGLMAGMGAYGGAGLSEALAGAGEGALSSQISGEIARDKAAEIASGQLGEEEVGKMVSQRLADTSGLSKAGAGLSAITQSPATAMNFAKQNVMPLAAAASPIMADAMVPTTTKMPTNTNPAYIRQYVTGDRPQAPRALAPVLASDWGSRSFQDAYAKPMATGGIVALAGGGNVVRMAEGTPPKMFSDEELFKQTGSWEAAAKLRDEQNNALNQYNWAQEAAAAAAKPEAQASTPAYNQYTNEQIASYLATNPNVDLQEAIKTTNADPAAVNAYIASLDNPFRGSTDTTGGSGTLGIYNQMKAQGIDPNELYSAAKAVDPNYAGWSASDIAKGYNLDKGAYALSDQLKGAVSDKDWAKFMDENNYSVDDMAQAFGLSRNEVKARYDAAKKAPVVKSTGIASLTGGTTPTRVTDTVLPTDPTVNAPPGTRNPYGGPNTPGDKTYNPDGSITVTPNIPGRPYGGFSGMNEVKNAYTAGGGSLGYTPYAPKTAAEHDALYNKQTGDSLAAYNYLIGKGSYPTKSGVSEIMKPYEEAVLGYPTDLTKKKYINVNGKMVLNPQYVAPQTQAQKTAAATAAAKAGKADTIYVTNNRGETEAATLGDDGNYRTSGGETYDVTGKQVVAQGGIMGYAGGGISGSGNLDLHIPLDFGGGGGGFGGASGTFGGGTPISTSNTFTGQNNTGGGGYGEPYRPDESGGLYKGSIPAGLDDSDMGSPAILARANANDAARAAAGTSPVSLDALAKALGGGSMFANGGMTGYAVGGGLGSLGSYSDGGRLLKGPGDGVSDSIPATIGRKQQPARLADGEFVIPARIVSELGNGSTDAGAKKLYAMMDRVQRARGKTTGKNKVAANSRADKYLPA